MKKSNSKIFSQACGDEYTFINVYGDVETTEVTWDWFHCKTTQKCIHASSRCDMHPNPECIFEKDGVLVSEDEEDCLEEYQLKGLIDKSATFECPSPDHNKNSKAIFSTVYTGGLILERILNLVQT